MCIARDHNTRAQNSKAYTKKYVGIVRIGVRMSRLAILTTKYTLLTSISYVLDISWEFLELSPGRSRGNSGQISLNKFVWFQAYSTFQKQLLQVKFTAQAG